MAFVDEKEAHQFAEDTKDLFFIGARAGVQYNGKLKSKEIYPFPEISSRDKTYHSMLRNIYDDIQAHPDLRVEVKDACFGPNGISTDFSQLLTIPGEPMKDATYAVIDNELLRDEMALSRGFETDRDREIFRKLMALRYGKRTNSRAKISKVSSSGFPFFISDVKFKAEHLTHLITNFSLFLFYLSKNNLKKILEVFKVVFCMFDVYRLQSDKNKIDGLTFKPKERLINNWLFAMTGGKRGKRYPADKTVVLHGAVVKWFSAMRARTANGFSIVINALLSSAFEGFRHYGDVYFEFTYKHKTRRSILEKIKKFKYYVPVDITQYDQSIAKWMVDEWIENSPFNDVGRKIVNLMFNAPMFYRGVSEKDIPKWTGDPLDINDYNQFRGLPSGAFCTSAMGKDFASWAMLCVYDRLTKDVLENMENILLGKHDTWGLLNQGDDQISLCNSRILTDYVNECKEADISISPYFRIDLEDGLKFLGNVGYLDEKGELQLCGDMGSFLVNKLIPERSITSKLKPYGVYGCLLRREVYSDNPSFHIIDGIFQENFKKYYKRNWFDYMNEYLVKPTVNGDVVVYSQADLEVIEDPTKRFYKYDESDISPHVLEQIEERVSEENCNAAISYLIKPGYEVYNKIAS